MLTRRGGVTALDIDASDRFQGADVLRGVALDQQQISARARAQRTEFSLAVDRFSRRTRRGMDDFERRHPARVHLLQLAPLVVESSKPPTRVRASRQAQPTGIGNKNFSASLPEVAVCAGG